MSQSPRRDHYSLLSFERNSEHIIYSQRAIASLLRTVHQKKAWLAVYTGSSQQAMLTMVLLVDGRAGEILLDCANDTMVNQSIIEAKQVIFVTRLDGIHIQFAVNKVELISYEDAQAFKISFPQMLLRQQRRENYRVSIPPLEGVEAKIKRDDMIDMIKVIDISAGGMKFSAIGNLGLEGGMQYEGCEIRLPEVGNLTVTIQIQHYSEVLLNNGSLKQYIGCKFIDLPADMEARIQRYIMELDRKQHKG